MKIIIATNKKNLVFIWVVIKVPRGKPEGLEPFLAPRLAWPQAARLAYVANKLLFRFWAVFKTNGFSQRWVFDAFNVRHYAG